MMIDTDELCFAPESEDLNISKQINNAWKIMIVDDDAEVHTITKIVLKDFTFDGKGLSFISAFSKQEANQLIQKHPDTALILLDIVMEEDDAGLHVVEYIRNNMQNSAVRIILRTGQPGQAPEEKIVLNYDINAYKTKNELTIEKLLTVVVASLRSYTHIKQLEEANNALELEIQERKRTEQLLRESEEKFRSITTSAQDAIILIDDEGNISFWNKSAQRIFGYTFNEIYGKNIHLLLAPKKSYENYKKGFSVSEEADSGVVSNNTLELTAIRKDGVEIPIELSVSASKVKSKWYACGIIRDITERKEYYKKLEDKKLTFEKFVPKQFLRHLGKEEAEDIKIGDASKELMTILFADIRNFTNLSESMTSYETFNFLNNYLWFIGPNIMKSGGFIDKFIGDAIMVLFSEHDTGFTDNALKCAIGIQETLKIYNIYRQKSNYHPISIGIGINTGKVTLGTIGFLNRMETTVVGDAVNITSRVERLTKWYNTPIIITSDTYNSLIESSKYFIREIDVVWLKGKKNTTTLYEVFDSEPEEIKKIKFKTLETFNEAIALYRQRNWVEAIRILQSLEKQLKGDVVIDIYLKRCLELLETPPDESWDGITKIDSK
ncbi:MAG: PAS domain S-box protein [Candidatus Magnetoovum sp. WYHC-5]|nr:PAS domain S-box protein [Candidatus Magnetoovum sp. WYHC-5]